MKTKIKMKTKTKTKTKMKTKIKIKTKMKMEMKTKTEIHFNFHFCSCFHYVFHFCFCFRFCFHLCLCFHFHFCFHFSQQLENQWQCSLFLFRQEILFSGKFDLKNQSCQFKVKLDTQANLNMHNSMAVFTFSVLDRKYTFQVNLVQKVKVVSLS